jgi:hypothetical protein
MDDATRELVRRRAADRCEYCGIHQHYIAARLHVEHVIARQHQGTDDPSNLALSCDRCNAYKGTNLSALDPVTSLVVMLFHPRLDRWHTHFAMQSGTIIGRTERGRATARLLNMNAHRRLQLRLELGASAAPPLE